MTTVYADVEQMLVGWVPTVVGAACSTELPANLQTRLPWVRVGRIGGPSNYGIDQPTVATDVFAATRPAAKALAYDLYSAFEFELPRYMNAYGTVLTAESISGPFWQPWDDTTLRRFGMTHRITVQLS